MTVKQMAVIISKRYNVHIVSAMKTAKIDYDYFPETKRMNEYEYINFLKELEEEGK